MSFVRSNVVRRAAPIQQQPPPTTAYNHPTTTQTTSTTNDSTSLTNSPSLPHTHAPISVFSTLPSSLLPSSTPPAPPASLTSLPLPGTRSWLHGLTFVPSGLPDLDSLLSGGLYLHSLVTLAEDESGHHDSLTRLFAAEAAEWQQHTVTVSTRATHTERRWFTHLPRAVRQRAAAAESSSQPATSEALRIAWRYGAYKDRVQDVQSNMRAASAVAGGSGSGGGGGAQRSHSLSHTFNLRLKSGHTAEQLSELHSHIQVVSDGSERSEASEGGVWMGVYDRVRSELKRLCGVGSGGGTAGRVVRVVIRSAADIDWCHTDNTTESHRHFLLFLHRLRGLLHHYPAVCLLTYPPALLSPSTVATVHHLSSLSLALHALPLSTPYRDYECLLHIHPPPPLHSLVSEAAANGTVSGGQWLVQCKEVVRLDKVSLPPEESRNEEGQGQAGQTGQVGQQGSGSGKQRGRVEVERDEVVSGGGSGGGSGGVEKGVKRHGAQGHSHGGMGCSSGGGSDW